MKHISNKWELKTQTAKYVLVETEDQIYQNVDGVYIPKRYFNTKEVQGILKITKDQMHKLIRKHGIRPPANKGKRIKITVQQMRKMS